MIWNPRRSVVPSGSFSLACSLLVLSLTLAGAGAPQYTISTFAGGAAAAPFAPLPGVNMFTGAVFDLTTDAAGNVYFLSGRVVFKLDPSGIVTSFAGTSGPGFPGDGGPATNSQLSQPSGMTMDAAGDLFIIDGYRVRRVAASGTITTVAGTGAKGSSGDGGPAVNAQLASPGAIAVDGVGNLFIADGNSIRKVSPGGIISTVAGNGTAGFSGDGGPAITAQLDAPSGLAVDATGNLYIADYENSRVRKVSTNGIISTVAGNGQWGTSGDGGPAIDAQLLDPVALALDSVGDLYITDCDCDEDASGGARIRKVSVGSGTITTVAGTGLAGFTGDGGQATSALLNHPTAIAVDGAGDLFVADSFNYRIRKVSSGGIITTVAGVLPPTSTNPWPGDGGPAIDAPLTEVWGVTVDPSGTVSLIDGAARKVSPDGTIHTLATVVNGRAITQDAAGNLFTAGTTVSKISPTGVITQVAGINEFGTTGIGGNGIAVDAAGNLFVASGTIVSKIAPNGAVSTVAGNGACCFSGDGGQATSAKLDNVTGLLLDSAGNLLIADTYANRVRKVSPDGIITTIAGNGTAGFAGDGGPATSAELAGPDGLALDAAGNLYIVDTYSNRVRLVTPDGTITTIAGIGPPGFSGDGGPAISAQFYNPWAIAVDQQGNVYVADTFNQRVRILKPAHAAALISSVVDAASQRAGAVSPGKIVTIYGAGLGPDQLVQNQASNGQFGTQIGGTAVSFNGISAPVLYASATQVAAVVPYAISGTTAQVVVTSQGQASPGFSISVTPSAPGIFSSNGTGGDQIAAINAVDGTINSAANPVKYGAFVLFYATGEGQTSPGGTDGKLGASVLPKPVLPVTVTIGGIPAVVEYAGGAPGQIAGLMQINVQIPSGVKPGGYVPVVLQVGAASTPPDAMWIAVSGN
jgi:trimeric autotransporter adhesin